MINSIYNFATHSAFSQSATLHLVVASRIFCLFPAIEMAINTIRDIGSFRYSSDNRLDIQAKALVEDEEEEIVQTEEDLKKERWKKIKNLSQDMLGALFFGFCACSQIPQIPALSASIFLLYSKLNWNKEDANLSTQVTGLLLKILPSCTTKIIKLTVKGTKNILASIIRIIQKISKQIIKGINCIKHQIKSVAKLIKNIFKLVFSYPLKLIKSSVKAITHAASKSLSFIKSIGKASISVAKPCIKGAVGLLKHPKLVAALIGVIALAIITNKVAALLSALRTKAKESGVATLANSMTTISKGLLIKSTQVVGWAVKQA